MRKQRLTAKHASQFQPTGRQVPDKVLALQRKTVALRGLIANEWNPDRLPEALKLVEQVRNACRRCHGTPSRERRRAAAMQELKKLLAILRDLRGIDNLPAYDAAARLMGADPLPDVEHPVYTAPMPRQVRYLVDGLTFEEMDAMQAAFVGPRKPPAEHTDYWYDKLFAEQGGYLDQFMREKRIRQRAYRKTPEGKAKAAEYQRKYRQSPEAKAKAAERQRKYAQSPKGIEARKRAQAAYRAKRKQHDQAV